jgi:hypothetical protein
MEHGIMVAAQRNSIARFSSWMFASVTSAQQRVASERRKKTKFD